jgi:sulfite reductase alpha subunit-like flavoprotein
MTLHISSDAAQKSAWENNAELLDVLRDNPSDVAAFAEHCTADDLHCLNRVHGVAGEIEIFDAVLHHPACDRATALQIFEAYNPFYYEQELAKDRPLDSYNDEEDQVFVAIIDMATEAPRGWPIASHGAGALTALPCVSGTNSPTAHP